MANTTRKAAVVSVVTRFDPKGESEAMDCMAAPVISPKEIAATGGIMLGFCLNLLAGTADASITPESVSTLFPHMSEADKSALRNCLKAKPLAMRKAWGTYVATLKRQTTLNLQGLAKALKGKSAVQADSLSKALTAWCTDNRDTVLPVELYDIFVQFELYGKE